MKRILLTLIVAMTALSGFAQRFTDKLDRGLVAIPGRSGGNFVSWKVFGEEYYDVTYNLYCNGSKIASNLKASNYDHQAGSPSSLYQVAAVVRGVEQTKCNAVSPWNDGYKMIKLIQPVDRNGNEAVYTDGNGNKVSYYQVNDISVGDLTGNGVVEFIVKRPCSDQENRNQNIRFHHLDCYDMDGNRLWWIDLGPNMCSGPDEQWDAVCYDWDEDGKAEVILRLEDGAIIHTKDGSTVEIGNMNVDTRNRVNAGPLNYTSAGNEYLLYLEGATGKPYQIGPAEHPNYMDYPLKRLETEEFDQYIDWSNQSAYSSQISAYNAKLSEMWGDSYGHRSTKHYWGAPFLDGRKASIFLGRGAYTQHKMCAYEVDPATHKLKQQWYWKNNVGWSSPWYGNGYHNFAIGDVDWDGRDEIIFGSMVIDDNGMGLSTTGYGHGDAQHCSDFDPYRHGAEQFACLEEGGANFGCNYRNATTAQIYVKQDAGGDTGRALMGNFTNNYPGSTGRSSSGGWISSVADKELTSLNGDAFINWADLNARIYWDGDLLDEFMDSPGEAKAAVVYKPGTYSRLVQCNGSLSNSSKNNAGVLGDILGDWREELVLRNGDNAMVIYTTNYPTEYRIPTLWHDHQYRNAMVWQSMGYNQPPHKSYFLGEMEDITVAPPPYTMTGRTEVKNGGTITTADEHLLVCETNDMTISIEDGASPYMVTFNVPSWVQGTAASNSIVKETPINYTYYTCTVNGGALTGSTRVVKQGDGILTLPAVDMTYTGETNIWAGTVNFNGSAANSGVWLNRFAVLNTPAKEATFKGLKADYASVVSPGGKDALGTIVADTAYTMGFGSRLVLDLYSDGLKADMIKTKKLTIEKKTWTFGPAYLMPVIEVVEHMEEGAETLADGKYLIANANTIVGNLASIKIEGVTNLKTGLEKDDNGNIYLVLGNIRGASEVAWKGGMSNIWDYANTENFYVLSDETQTPDVFVQNDNITFDDNATKFTVKLADAVDLPAGDILVSNTKTYTFQSTSGKIVSGSFTKENTGTVTMAGDNTYTGGNYLKGGTVRVSSLANSTQAYGNLGGMTSLTTRFTMENGATLQSTAAVRMGSPIQMKSDEGGCINNNAAFTMEKAITGTLFTKKGNGTFDMQGKLSVRKLTVAAGSLSYSTAAYNYLVTMQGTSSITGTGFLASPIFVDEGAKATLNTINRQTHTNKISGTGQITINCATEHGGSGNNTYYATRTPLRLDLSAFEGTVVVGATNNSSDSNGATGRVFTLDTDQGSAKSTFNIPANFFMKNTGKSFRIGQVKGSGALAGYCEFGNGGSGTNTWNVGNDGDFVFGGTVIDNAIFNKLGTGKMTASGQWTTTGNVNIYEGTLVTTGTLGTGTLTLAAVATMGGNTTLTNSAYNLYGTVKPGGHNAADYKNSLNFGGKNVTFGEKANLVTTVYRPMNDKGRSYNTTISNIGTLTIPSGATITVEPFTEDIQKQYMKPADGEEEHVDSIMIWTNVATVSMADDVTLDLPELLFSEWDTSRIKEGVLLIRTKKTDYENYVTGISDIAADKTVRVTVFSMGGAPLAEYTSTMNNVRSAFANVSLPHGTYILRIKSENGKNTSIKLMK